MSWYIDGIKTMYFLIVMLFMMTISLVLFILLYPFLFNSIIQDILVYVIHKLDKIYNMFWYKGGIPLW